MPNEKTIRFVELVRVSTSGQAERDTPEAQRRALDKMRARYPGTLVRRIEVPDGVSGAKEFAQRPDLQELATLAATKAFDELRVFAIDRLTRHPDLRERSLVFGLLADAGAKVIDVSGQQIDPREEVGELHWSMLTWASAMERKKIAARMKAGKERNAAAGRLAQGQPPFGRTFDKESGTWGIDEERARAYRKMFSLALAGSSLNQIAAKLNAQGSLCSPRGLPWTGSNVCRLLRDEAAFGKYTAQGHTFQIPAIVDEATFRAVKAKLKSNNSLSGPKPSIFALLRKIAVCGECESPMYLQLGGAESRIRYYHCSSHDPDCHRYLRVDDVDPKVIERLRKWLNDPDTLNDAAGRGAPEDAEEVSRRDIAEAERDLRDLDRQEERLARLLSKGLTAKVHEKLFGEIQHNRADARNRLAQAKARLDDASRQAEFATSLAEVMAGMRKRLASDSPAKWRELVEIVFPPGGIRVFPDGAIEFDGRIPVAQPVRSVNRKPTGSIGTTSA